MPESHDTSDASRLPTDEPQAPKSISVESVDDGNVSYNPDGSRAHGPKACDDKSL